MTTIERTMTDDDNDDRSKRQRIDKLRLFGVLIALAVVVYASLMVKIIAYGP